MTPRAMPSSHADPTAAAPASATPSAQNCADTTVRGAIRSTSGTSNASPSMYPTGPLANAPPTSVSDAPNDPATSAMAGCSG